MSEENKPEEQTAAHAAAEAQADTPSENAPESATGSATDEAAAAAPEDNAAPEIDSSDPQAAQASAAYARAMAQNQGKPQSDNTADNTADNTENDAPETGGEQEIPVSTDAAPAEAADNDLAAQVADLKDRLLRQMAETENLRNRMKRDVEDAGKYAVAKIARDVLTIGDNLKRATDSVPEEGRDAEPLKSFYEGVMLTERELIASMEKHQIVAVNPEVGEKFDPNMHEAMFEAPVAGAPAGSVIQVMEVGYRIHDRLLRPARVGVAKAG